MAQWVDTLAMHAYRPELTHTITRTKVEERTNSTTLSSDLHLCAYPHNNNRICSQIWSFLLRLSVWIKSNHLFVLIYVFSKTSGPMATLTMLEFCWESKWKYNQDKMGSWEVMLFYWSQESLVMKVSFRWLLEQSTWVLFVIVSLPTSPLCPHYQFQLKNKHSGTAFKDSFFNMSSSLCK